MGWNDWALSRRAWVQILIFIYLFLLWSHFPSLSLGFFTCTIGVLVPTQGTVNR